jgi:pimeloyl-ACP methyl ester carboxylesterase
VVGWSWGGGQALALACATPLQACVICDGPLSFDAALVAGLRHTAVLGIFAAPDKARAKEVGAFRHAMEDAGIPHKLHVFPGTKVHFMGPPTHKEYLEEPAEQAWFEIYEFLGKHVEDAGLSKEKKVLGKGKSLATIADIMRAVNQPTGVRGVLIEALKEKPADEQQWKQVRAHAVLIAEAGHWLENMKPNKGAETDWRKQAGLYQKTAMRIVTAADGRDYETSLLALQELGNQCAACHKQHR